MSEQTPEEALAEREKHIKILNTAILKLQKEFNNITRFAEICQEQGKEIAEILIQYGQHNLDCAIWELRSSGRIVNMNDSDVCSCGWSEIKTQLLEAKKLGESGHLTVDFTAE